MKEKMPKELAVQLMGLLEPGEKIALGTIRGKLGTEWVKGDAAKGNKQLQVNLENLTSFRINVNNEAMTALSKKLVEGRTILYSFHGVSTAEGKQNISTFSGSAAKAPAKFINLQDVTILMVGKGQALETFFEEDLGEDEEPIFEKKASGQGQTQTVPEVGAPAATGAPSTTVEESTDY